MRMLSAALALPWRRPRTALIVAGLATALAIAAAARLRVDTSLDAMFPENDPAAAAMLRVLDQYGTTDELLLLVSLPADEKGPDPDRLLEYADRFGRAVAASPSTAALCEAVQYRIDPDITRFIEQEIAPAALFYLDDASLATARQRLSPQGMRAQLSRDQSLMSQPGPATGALAKALMRDPLNLRELLLPRLAAAAPFKTYQNSDALIAPDGRAILIRVLGKEPLTHLDYSVKLTEAMTTLAEQAEPRGLTIAFTGGYAIAAQSQKSIRHDAVWGVFGSVSMLLGLFVAVYRRPARLFLFAFVPVVVGIVWGFGVYAAVGRSLSPMAAVIGGVLAGMGIDYSILYLTRYQSIRGGGAGPQAAAQQTLRDIGTALLAAWVTSVAGFLAIGWSTVRALRDFAILGTLGLGGSFLAALFVLPAWLTLSAGDAWRFESIFRFSIDPLLRWIERHRIALGAACAIVGMISLAVALWPGGVLKPETNLMVMHPQPSPPLEAEAELSRRFGIPPGTMLIQLQAGDPASLVALAYNVERRLSSAEVKAAGVSGILSVANWLPDPAAVAARAKTATPAQAQRVVADFQVATADSPFNPAAFESYGHFLAGLVNPASAPTLATLARYPGVARNLLPRHADGRTSESVAIVFLNHRTEDRAARDAAIDAIRQALQGVGGATLTGLPVVGHDAESAVWHELSRLLLAAALLVAGYLLLHFRRVSDMLLSLLPAALGLAILAAIVRLAGIRLNLINLVALPLLIGIDVDYGIYLVSLSRRRGAALASGAQAVLVCAASMIAGYASLALTSVPAVRSLGEVVALGVAACVGGAMFLLYPLLGDRRLRQMNE